jgi:hypothetical protein
MSTFFCGITEAVPSLFRRVYSAESIHAPMTVGYCKIFTLAGKILNENRCLMLPITLSIIQARYAAHTAASRAHALNISLSRPTHGAS